MVQGAKGKKELTMNTQQKLDRIAELQLEQGKRDAEKQALIDSILTQEIKDKIADIEAEYNNGSVFSTEIESLTNEVKQDVLTLGQTVKGSLLMAVWSKGRVTWDTKSLDGYIIDHPELDKFRKEGEPSVSIRKA